MAKYSIDYFKPCRRAGHYASLVWCRRYFYPNDASAKAKKSLIYTLTTPYQLDRSAHQELTFPVYDPRVTIMAAGKVYV